MNSACSDIAQRTNDLVDKTSQHALSVDDPDLIDDLTRAIHATASSVASLVSRFQTMMKDYVAPNQKAFAVATKEFGDALNQLLLTLDASFVNKIERAVRAGKKAVSDFASAARVSKEELLRTAQDVAASNINVCKAADAAAKATLDSKKAVVFRDGSGKVKDYSTGVIRAGQAMANSPSDKSHGDRFFQEERSLFEVYDLLLETARKSSLLGFGRLGDLLSTIDDLLAKLAGLKGGFAALINAIGTDAFVGLAKDMLRNVMDAIALGQKVMDSTDDPIVKYKLEELLEKLRDGAKRLIVAAQEAHKDPTNKAKRDAVLAINKELDLVIDEVMRLLDPSNPLSSKDRVLMGTQVCDILAAKVALFTNDGGEPLAKASKGLLLASDQVHRDAHHLGTQMANPELEAKLKDLTGDLRNLANKETGEARSRSAAVNGTRDNIFQKTAAIREVVQGDWRVKQKEPEKKKTDGLVAAAEDQKRQAYLVAEEAERFAEGVSDTAKRDRIRGLARQVRQDADELVRAAEAYDADPNNAALERQFSETQKRLVDRIGEIVNLIGDQAAKDALGSLFGLQDGGADGSIFRLIDDVIAEIDHHAQVGDDAQKGVNAAQSIGFKCKELSDQLRKMANNKQAEGAFREQLNSYANGVRDQALQLKILSAVKLADLGGDQATKDKTTSSGQQVQNQVRGLRKNLVDLKKQLFAEALQRRTSNTLKQANAIQKIAQAFIASRNKK